MNNKTNNKKHQRILQVQKKNDNDDKKRTLAVAVLTRNKCKEVVVVAVETISKYWQYRFRRNSLWILVKASMDAGFTMENMDKLR